MEPTALLPRMQSPLRRLTMLLLVLLGSHAGLADDLADIEANIERHLTIYTARALDGLPRWQQRLLAGKPAGVPMLEATRTNSPTAGIQEAVDALPADGGIVLLKRGTYRLRHAVSLRSNIALVGEDGAILVREPVAVARLGANAAAGDTTILAPGHRFAVGDRIAVRATRVAGWNNSRGAVVAVDGDRIVVDPPLRKDYAVAGGAFVTDASPIIQAVAAKNVIVRNVLLQSGNGTSIPSSALPRVDFTDAAIHFHEVRNAVVEDVTVRGYEGESIGLQSGSNIIARDNVVEKSLSHGIHIGTSIADSIVTGNTARENGGDGVYFCASVRNVLVQRNTIARNKGNGIGGLGDVNDRSNIVYRNTITGNAMNGILIQEWGNLVFRNDVSRNGTAGSKFANIKFDASAVVNVVLGNRVEDDVPHD